MRDISELSSSQKAEIANYIRRDNLGVVNKQIEPVKVKGTFYTKYGKRCIDIVISFFAVAVTLPINFVLAIITFFNVGSPIIFRQQRIGKDEKVFTLYKFRNMTNETDANGELLPASERVTRWGKIARKTSLDELLNFVSILKGDMSIIGPRPLLDIYCERMNTKHKAIYKVRPGLECPTLHGMGHSSSWQERLDNYTWYVENCSFALDVRLMFRVACVAFDSKSTSKRSKAEHGGFMGYDVEGNVISTKEVPEKYVDKFLKTHQYKELNEAIEDRYC